jgi:hypothetical protein
MVTVMVCLDSVLLRREHMCFPPTSRPTPSWSAPTYSHEQVNAYHPDPTVSQQSMIRQLNSKQAVRVDVPRWSGHVVVRSCGWWVVLLLHHYSQILSSNKFTILQGNLHINVRSVIEERRRWKEDTFDGTRHSGMSVIHTGRWRGQEIYMLFRAKPWNFNFWLGNWPPTKFTIPFATFQTVKGETLLHLQMNTLGEKTKAGLIYFSLQKKPLFPGSLFDLIAF